VRERWDGDTRGVGVMSGQWIAGSVTRLSEALAKPDWVAESPERHLLAPIQRICASPNAAWRLKASNAKDGVFTVDLEWTGTTASLRDLRADVFALIGRLAEGNTFVRQKIVEGGLEYHVATGEIGDDSSFGEHGHLMQMYVTAPRMAEMLAGRYR
jgi:expansin (peptidoglycan-binding protein)